MKKKNIFATFLISIATVFAVLGYHVFSKNNPFMNLKAEDDYYEMSIVDGAFEPYTIYDEYSGVLSDHYNEFFYLSHKTALGERELRLIAKDENTPAVICNKTVINGIISVKVDFTNGPLYAIVTSSFFERYEYDANDLLTSGVEKTFSGDDLGYLLILSTSTDDTKTGATTVTDIVVKYRCEHDTDKGFFYAPGINRYTGARSWGANRIMKHDYLEFTTDPNPYNNNYSPGKTAPHDNVDSWYRWNGLSLRNHYLENEVKKYDGLPFGEFSSNSFEVIASVIVQPSIFYDQDAWFCVAPWVCLDNEDHSSELGYVQSYIGNDNYDPRGEGGIANRNDTYTGRFYTTYSAGGGGHEWGFVDPDVATVIGEVTTLREAYEATNLPFFNVRFEIIENTCAVYINGFKVEYEEDAFYDVGEYTDQKYSINNICLHGVNYGLKDGTAGTIESEYAPYRLAYLNPIVREII